MSYKLIIVESPEKAKVISRFLDSTFRVVASKGHILDLPQKEYGIQKSGANFKGEFIPSEDSKKTIAEIKALAKESFEVFLATDDDREGERIAADLIEQCSLRNYHRIVFSEISKKTVLHALQQPRPLSKEKLAGQKARRLIDRIVGYPGSRAIVQDFKNQNIPYEPTAIGRSIAPALRLLCQVEEAIQDFEDNPPPPKKLIRAKLEKSTIQFVAKHDHEFGDEERGEMELLINMLRRSPCRVIDYSPESSQRNPPKPLTTSSYQFGCFYLFGLMPKRAMEIAQDLYQLGFISYMRTDSNRVPLEKAIDLMQVVRSEFGEEYCAESPRLYEAQDDNSQDAHPAILPTSFEFERYPKKIEELWRSDRMFAKLLSDENYYKVYQFIFLRAVASQMAPARFSTAKATLQIADAKFIAKENMLIFDGWQKLSRIIQEQSDEDAKDFISTEENIALPSFEVGEVVKIQSIFSVEAPHQRPRRYGVGRFVSTLKKMGIVRPSTMDKIVEKLLDIHYVQIEAKIVVPTKLGKKVDTWMGLELPEINSLENAAAFEEKIEQCKSEEEADALIKEYYELTFGLLGSKGIFYQENKNQVSDKKIAYAKKVAAESGVVLADSFFEDGKKVEEFLFQYNKALSVGKCPACKKGQVIEKEKVFACDNFKMNCKFTLWKDSAHRFFENFGKSVDGEFLKDIVKNALNKSPIMLELVSTKKGTSFPAFIIIEQTKPPYWNLGFKFGDKNSSKSNKNGQNLNERGQVDTDTAHAL